MMDRRSAMEKYVEAKRAGRVDNDIIALLDMLNSIPGYYTTSSCSGRIVIMQLPDIGDKVNSVFLGKWHREVTVNEVKDAMAMYSEGFLFLMVQSAILHVVAEDMEHAKMLINVARDSGFKYSSIRSVSPTGILVELLSTENLSVPLGNGGNVMITDAYLDFLVELANTVLRRIKNKLLNLEKKLSSLPRDF